MLVMACSAPGVLSAICRQVAAPTACTVPYFERARGRWQGSTTSEPSRALLAHPIQRPFETTPPPPSNQHDTTPSFRVEWVCQATNRLLIMLTRSVCNWRHLRAPLLGIIFCPPQQISGHEKDWHVRVCTLHHFLLCRVALFDLERRVHLWVWYRQRGQRCLR